MKALLALVLILSFGLIHSADAGMTVKGRKVANTAQSSFTDTIKKIRDDDEGVVVLFDKNAGSYYLRRDVAEFEALKKKLDESFKAKKPVSVTFDSAQLNILEVK